MFRLMFEQSNLPFAVSLVVMVGIGVLEGAATLVGAGLSHFLDSVVDSHFDLEHDAFHPELESPGVLGRFFDWLHVGRVPLLAIVVVFLLCFGLGGLLLQGMVRAWTGTLLPAYVAVIPAFLLTLPLVRTFVGGLARVMPKDETTAVARASFVGRVAKVGNVRAVQGEPAPAKLRDQHGQVHYILVEPDTAEETFEPGSAVLIVSHAGAVFRAISNPHPKLTGDA